MNYVADIWSKILLLMEQEITVTTINTWFDDAVAVALEENRFLLHSPTPFKRDIIRGRYLPVIQKALFELFSSEFEIVILDQLEEPVEQNDDIISSPSESLSSTDGYTFDRFVVGNSNKFAHAAAEAVANNPGFSYNPLFIHGESGLGKTHLMYAIADTIKQNHPNYNIVYIRGDSFTNELIQAIRDNTNERFRQKYRSADVFLMDDVQFVAGRESTQEEMFHTFNTLFEAKKQIVFTADRPPKEMLRLEDRLKTRFEWGLLADIQPPDYETRMAIIKNKAIRMGFDLPEEVLIYVAENITANVRQIEGTVNKILAFRDLLGNNVDAGNVTRAVRDMFKDPHSILPSADVIIEEVCKFYTIEEDELRGQSRIKETVQARHIAMFLIRSMTNLSLKEIGKEFEDRDHTTVLHSITKIEDLKGKEPETAEILKDIKTNINIHYE